MSNDQYQSNYSLLYKHELEDVDSRKRKALLTLSVIKDYYGNKNLKALHALEIGCFAGEISLHLYDYFGDYTAIDIDANAINIASAKAGVRKNLTFILMNGEKLDFKDGFFDVVLCSHIYEHVPHPDAMVKEIYRVLKNDGICYFAAGNKYWFMEPHHRLPFLSWLPKKFASMYVKYFRGIDEYYENHYSYYKLSGLVDKFFVIDYTKDIIDDPEKFHATDMIQKGTIRQTIAKLFCTVMYAFFPSYIWILQKKRSPRGAS